MKSLPGEEFGPLLPGCGARALRLHEFSSALQEQARLSLGWDVQPAASGVGRWKEA